MQVAAAVVAAVAAAAAAAAECTIVAEGRSSMVAAAFKGDGG